MPLNITLINERVDRALSDNRRAEYIVINMSVCIFGLGVSETGQCTVAGVPRIGIIAARSRLGQ